MIYNIACDIVVNSFILETLGQKEFKICGENAMHIAPDKTEGREHTAEKVYKMLLQDENISQLAASLIDSHDGWAEIDAQRAKDEWGRYISDTARRMNGFDSVPLGMRRYLKEVSRTPTTNWRQLLQDYIRFDRIDYDFTSPDRRYDGDFLMPSFRENMFGDVVKGLWLMVDASGSVDDEALSEVMNEIYALCLVKQLRCFGKLPRIVAVVVKCVGSDNGGFLFIGDVVDRFSGLGFAAAAFE